MSPDEGRHLEVQGDRQDQRGGRQHQRRQPLQPLEREAHRGNVSSVTKCNACFDSIAVAFTVSDSVWVSGSLTVSESIFTVPLYGLSKLWWILNDTRVLL